MLVEYCSVFNALRGQSSLYKIAGRDILLIRINFIETRPDSLQQDSQRLFFKNFLDSSVADMRDEFIVEFCLL